MMPVPREAISYHGSDGSDLLFPAKDLIGHAEEKFLPLTRQWTCGGSRACGKGERCWWRCPACSNQGQCRPVLVAAGIAKQLVMGEGRATQARSSDSTVETVYERFRSVMRPLGLRVWMLAALASLALHAMIIAIPLTPRPPASRTFDGASAGGSGADTSSIPPTAARPDEGAIDASALAGSLPLPPIDAARGPRAKSLSAPESKRAASTSAPDAKAVVVSSARTRAQNRTRAPPEDRRTPPSGPLQARAPQKDPPAEKPQARSGAVAGGAPTQGSGSGGLSAAAGPGVAAGASASADGKGVSDDSALSLESVGGTGVGDAGKAEVGELGTEGGEGDTVSPLPTGRAAQSPAQAMPYPAPAAHYGPAPVYAPPPPAYYYLPPAYYYPPPAYYAPAPGYYAGPPIYGWSRRHKHEEEEDD